MLSNNTEEKLITKLISLNIKNKEDKDKIICGLSDNDYTINVKRNKDKSGLDSEWIIDIYK